MNAGKVYAVENQESPCFSRVLQEEDIRVDEEPNADVCLRELLSGAMGVYWQNVVGLS